MGVDIHVKIVHFNHETRYFEELKLFKLNEKKELVPVDVYSYRNSEMFNVMQGHEDYNDIPFPASPLEFGSLEPELQEEILKEKDNLCYGFSEISISEFGRYLENNMKVEDYDADWGENGENVKYKDNPLNSLYEAVINFISFADDYVWSYKDYKVIYYFDC